MRGQRGQVRLEGQRVARLERLPRLPARELELGDRCTAGADLEVRRRAVVVAALRPDGRGRAYRDEVSRAGGNAGQLGRQVADVREMAATRVFSRVGERIELDDASHLAIRHFSF
jgi:hypothetical protein